MYACLAFSGNVGSSESQLWKLIGELSNQNSEAMMDNTNRTVSDSYDLPGESSTKKSTYSQQKSVLLTRDNSSL